MTEEIEELLKKTPQKRLFDVQVRFLMERMDNIDKSIVRMQATFEQWKAMIDHRCENHTKELTDARLALEGKASKELVSDIDKRSFKSSIYISLLTSLPTIITMIGGFLLIAQYLKSLPNP